MIWDASKIETEITKQSKEKKNTTDRMIKKEEKKRKKKENQNVETERWR